MRTTEILSLVLATRSAHARRGRATLDGRLPAPLVAAGIAIGLAGQFLIRG